MIFPHTAEVADVEKTRLSPFRKWNNPYCENSLPTHSPTPFGVHQRRRRSRRPEEARERALQTHASLSLWLQVPLGRYPDGQGSGEPGG